MKTKLLPVLLILLIVLNGFLIFMLINKPHERQRPNQERNFLITELGFNDTQKNKFLALDEIHRENMLSFDEEIRKNKDILFNSFSDENFNSDLIINKISISQAKKETELFSFFSKVRKLCSETQIKKFDRIIKKALRGGNNQPPRDGRKHPPRKGQMPPPR
ncbi:MULTISPECIES: hypothetical protein [Tenacibaculum]|uniref:hypothetical protein n=1 Tax=Tenacibaculum TaxID=104267 RepID=UPI001F0A3825|nr:MULTISPECIES: hypothetical protein [Tenacibaculum]MCH3882700.1 hypothetical protein [Tenacibaculum aquimarinum]MDO6600269.1 hypothetical protein [Tenacibaculum sp. 1_MG-2023]